MSDRCCRWPKMRGALAASASPDEPGLPLASGPTRHSSFFVSIPMCMPPWLPQRAKCRKYLELFDQADVLDKFFSTKTPQVLVITMEAAYIAYHKQWTEEVLAERGDRGRAYSNRFLIGAYDTGISDMTLLPEQFFCAPRFSIPFLSTPHSVFG